MYILTHRISIKLLFINSYIHFSYMIGRMKILQIYDKFWKALENELAIVWSIYSIDYIYA